MASSLQEQLDTLATRFDKHKALTVSVLKQVQHLQRSSGEHEARVASAITSQTELLRRIDKAQYEKHQELGRSQSKFLDDVQHNVAKLASDATAAALATQRIIDAQVARMNTLSDSMHAQMRRLERTAAEQDERLNTQIEACYELVRDVASRQAHLSRQRKTCTDAAPNSASDSDYASQSSSSQTAAMRRQLRTANSRTFANRASIREMQRTSGRDRARSASVEHNISRHDCLHRTTASSLHKLDSQAARVWHHVRAGQERLIADNQALATRIELIEQRLAQPGVTGSAHVAPGADTLEAIRLLQPDVARLMKHTAFLTERLP